MTDVRLPSSWKTALSEEFGKAYFLELTKQVKEAYLNGPVYPPPKLVFHALELCPLEKVKVVILGQDPYHGPGQAHGLSFSVPDGVTPPPSLKNIYKEIQSDLGTTIPNNGNLERWATQGVLLLNATLTVRRAEAGSHQKLGWEKFTDAIIKAISDQNEQVVFLLWGNFARKKAELIDKTKHLILEAPHPSPFSAHSGFFGSKHFSKANQYLTKHQKEPIKW